MLIAATTHKIPATRVKLANIISNLKPYEWKIGLSFMVLIVQGDSQRDLHAALVSIWSPGGQVALDIGTRRQRV